MFVSSINKLRSTVFESCSGSNDNNAIPHCCYNVFPLPNKLILVWISSLNDILVRLQSLSFENKLPYLAQLAEAVEYTNCFSAGGEDLPTSVLDMTLNNLIVRFQWCWSFREFRAPFHCHCSQVHSCPEW